MIEIKNLNKSYGKKKNIFQVLKDINLTINTGEAVAIIGKSGSGKSTLMHIISGLDRPDNGQVIIDGEDISKLKNKKINQFRNNKIGFVFQTFFLQPKETCLENIMLPLEIKGESLKVRKQKALDALKQVGMEEKAKSKANDLSGGQKQRLCIARAIINSPEIIFADEPTGNLDSENGKMVIDMLFKLHKDHGKTLIIVTHDQDLANICERRIHLADGIITHID